MINLQREGIHDLCFIRSNDENPTWNFGFRKWSDLPVKGERRKEGEEDKEGDIDVKEVEMKKKNMT